MGEEGPSEEFKIEEITYLFDRNHPAYSTWEMMWESRRKLLEV